jgi:hypothetical protein
LARIHAHRPWHVDPETVIPPATASHNLHRRRPRCWLENKPVDDRSLPAWAGT